MRTILFSFFFTFSFFYSSLYAQSLSEQYLVLGPFPVADGVDNPGEEKQQEGFRHDLLDPGQVASVEEGMAMMHKAKVYYWQAAKADDSHVDLDAFFEQPDYVYAYAYAEIEAPEAGKQLIGVGSDDGIRIWLNGELVHDHYALRGHRKNEDLIEFEMKKGINTVLVRIQDNRYDWGFSLNYADPENLSELLVATAGQGNLDQAALLLRYGADPNKADEQGLTAWQASRMKGRDDMAAFLEKNGAKTDIPFPAPETMADELFQPLTEGKFPGAAVLVASDGKIVYQKGFGYADVEKGVPVSPDTKFRIGSISKQFTAAAILKLVEAGKMNLDDPLSKYIPDFPRGDEVTIHHLLTHTSGIHSYTNTPDFLAGVTEAIDWKDLLEKIKGYTYNFDPGTNWLYNNSGYFILGYLVEQVSGLSFQDYLKKTFFDPIGMKNTGVYVNGQTYKHEALGYDYENDSLKRALDWDMSWAGGAGNLYSTVGDLFLWNEAVFSGKVLSEKTLKAAHTPVLLDNGEQPEALGADGYGYGWAISQSRDVPVVSHSGGLHGFVTNLARLPEQNLTVAVLTNSLPSVDMSPGEYTLHLVEYFAWKDLGKQSSFSVDKNIDYERFDDFVGQYEYPGGGIMVVTRSGEHLYAKLAYQPTSEIFPKDDHTFFWKEVDAQIEFVRDENGVVTHGIHTQSGQTLRVPRIEPEEAIKLDPAILETYTGVYELAGMTLTITTDGKALFAEVPGQPTLELLPKSETEFFLKVVRAYITFGKDETGKVTHLMLDQAGIQQKAERRE